MTGTALPSGTRFHLLYVCTGNMFRSVLAERYTRRLAEVRLGAVAARLDIHSAGTLAVPGQAAHPRTVTALAALGIDASAHRTRRLTIGMLAEAHLVLTATVEQRDTAIDMLPTALGRVFSLREFVRLSRRPPGRADDVPCRPPGRADDVPHGDRNEMCVADACDLIAAVARRRGREPSGSVGEDDIADPRGRPAVFRDCVHSVIQAVETSFDVLSAAFNSTDPLLDAGREPAPVEQGRARHRRCRMTAGASARTATDCRPGGVAGWA